METTLQCTHGHARDARIQFFEEGHRYVVDNDADAAYTSVTTLVHRHFAPFDAEAVIAQMMRGRTWGPGHKYWGLTREQIAAQWAACGASASAAGTAMHAAIELFYNVAAAAATADADANKKRAHTFDQLVRVGRRLEEEEGLVDRAVLASREWSHFLHFAYDTCHALRPYRTEWRVFHEELRISGTIDMVFAATAADTEANEGAAEANEGAAEANEGENDPSSIFIYDWKRSKEIVSTTPFGRTSTTPCLRHLPDTNYWHYALQLNVYKYILESKYGKTVRGMRLVRLHPNAVTYEVISVPVLAQEIADMVQLLRAGM